MNYPVWFLPAIGGGTLIALISIVHVFISHFAVGGGLYLVCAERKGLREGNPAILAFNRRHARFFLLMTMVMGGITGVGIWFVIALVSPAATSLLIHNFVFGWATEWVFFIVEIVAVFVYYYRYDVLDSRTHQLVGWIYFAAAWLSLFVINGIVGFMLTPGAWTADGNFWSGFFNPSFWPALVFRTFVSLMLAGVYAFISTSRLQDLNLRNVMTRYSAKWVLLSLLAAAPSAWWYLSVLPARARSLAVGASPTVLAALKYGLYGVLLVVAATLALLVIRPALHGKAATLVVVAGAFIFMGSFEWTREASRRPYVINGIMYSNSIPERDLEEIVREGYLHEARWVGTRMAYEGNLLEAGRELFRNQCYACHTVRGVNNDIAVRTARMDFPALFNYLGRMHEIRYFMPPFAGNDEERKALAFYIVKGIQGKEAVFVKQVTGAAGRGRELFTTHCTICHPESLVKERTAAWDRDGIRRALDHLNRLQPAMPDYQGTPEEKELVADYIFSLRGAKNAAGHDEGQEVFDKHCAGCHSLTGGLNPVLPMMAGWDRARIRGSLDRLDRLRGGMPPLRAPAAEKESLATYLSQALKGGAR